MKFSRTLVSPVKRSQVKNLNPGSLSCQSSTSENFSRGEAASSGLRKLARRCLVMVSDPRLFIQVSLSVSCDRCGSDETRSPRRAGWNCSSNVEHELAWAWVGCIRERRFCAWPLCISPNPYTQTPPLKKYYFLRLYYITHKFQILVESSLHSSVSHTCKGNLVLGDPVESKLYNLTLFPLEFELENWWNLYFWFSQVHYDKARVYVTKNSNILHSRYFP